MIQANPTGDAEMQGNFIAPQGLYIPMPEEITEEEITAYHEAGHAVAAFVLWKDIEYVTIIPNEKSYGHLRRRFVALSFRENVIGEILVCLAGPAAEAHFWGDSESYFVYEPGSDYGRAYELIEMLDVDDPDVFLTKLERSAYRLVSQYNRWKAVQSLARELLIYKHLEAGRINDIVETALGRSKMSRHKTRYDVYRRTIERFLKVEPDRGLFEPLPSGPVYGLQ